MKPIAPPAPESRLHDVPQAWDAPAAAPTRMAKWRQTYADFWLRWLFWHAGRAPMYTRVSRPFYLFFAWHTSKLLRDGTLANARHLLGPNATFTERRRLAQSVIANFYRFICDVARIEYLPVSGLLSQIEGVDGIEHFHRARALKRGTIVVTAHLGSFEVGLASLRELEPNIHVLFHRDPRARFESMRRTLREKIGVLETPVESGLDAWIRLRDALASDHVIVMQGDRVMPGQRGLRVPFMDGHILLPPGPVKLALATGAPIVPIFAPRMPSGKVKIFVNPMICADGSQPRVGADHPAIQQLTLNLENAVRRWPDQWLVLQKIWCEDLPNGSPEDSR